MENYSHAERVAYFIHQLDLACRSRDLAAIRRYLKVLDEDDVNASDILKELKYVVQKTTKKDKDQDQDTNQHVQPHSVEEQMQSHRVEKQADNSGMNETETKTETNTGTETATGGEVEAGLFRVLQETYYAGDDEKFKKTLESLKKLVYDLHNLHSTGNGEVTTKEEEKKSGVSLEVAKAMEKRFEYLTSTFSTSTGGIDLQINNILHFVSSGYVDKAFATPRIRSIILKLIDAGVHISFVEKLKEFF